MRWSALAWLALLAVPAASAHGALAINEFDTYAIGDFEGHEDSFPWEGFEIWDVYAGDGHMAQNGSHGVYFKVNFAGDGTVRPSDSQMWEVAFTFNVGEASFERTIVHDGSEVTTDFEALEWQIADGNVFQVHAWVPITHWEGQSITDLVVLSSVDGDPRDIAPGGVYDPATGQEVPVEAPSTVVFPPIGEGRIVDEVPLTGAAKFLNVSVTPEGDGGFSFEITNPLAEQGQHLMFRVDDVPGWNIDGLPNAESLDGGATTEPTVRFTPADNGTIEPLRFDLLTDIGGRQTYYAFIGADGVEVTQDQELARPATLATPNEEAPGPAALVVVPALLVEALVKRRL